MKRWCLIYLVILATISGSAFGDCGCSKQKRNAQPPIPVDDDLSSSNSASLNNIEPNDDDEDSTFKRLVRVSRDHMSLIPGDRRSPIGTDKPVFAEDRESPVREVKVESFYLDRYEVSNGDFAGFVEATGYRTDAEVFGDSFVFRDEISKETQDEYVDSRVAGATWWYKVRNVTWQHPEGSESNIDGEG